MGSLSAMEDPEVGSAHALPACPSGAREADTVRGPACDGMLSPLVSPPLPAPPPSTSLPSAPKIHHFVMDTYCVRLRALPSASSSAREADLVRGPLLRTLFACMRANKAQSA